jgi:hypothetical protein
MSPLVPFPEPLCIRELPEQLPMMPATVVSCNARTIACAQLDASIGPKAAAPLVARVKHLVALREPQRWIHPLDHQLEPLLGRSIQDFESA